MNLYGWNAWLNRRQSHWQKPLGPSTRRLMLYRFRKALAPVMQGGYRDPFLRTVILDGKTARMKSVYLLPPICGLLFLRHTHPFSLYAGQDRSGQKVWEGGLLRRLRSSGRA